MTANVPTIPIVRVGDDKLDRLRSERRKTTRGGITGRRSPPQTQPQRGDGAKSPPSARKATRRLILEDDEDDVGRSSSPNLFTRRKTAVAGIARRETRRRETTAGSVLLDDDLRESVPSPRNLVAGPEYKGEYVTNLPAPHSMDDTPYQQASSSQKPRHRRKVSRHDVDPVQTHSSPAVLNAWDVHPKHRKMGGAIDPAW